MDLNRLKGLFAAVPSAASDLDRLVLLESIAAEAFAAKARLVARFCFSFPPAYLLTKLHQVEGY